MEKRDSVQEQEAQSCTDPLVRRVSSLEEAPGWRRPTSSTNLVTIVPATKTPPELKELERYLILALILVSVALLLSLLDKAGESMYVTAVRVPITFAICVICVTAIVRLRRAKRGLIRTGEPAARDAVTGLPDEQYFWLRLREEHTRNRRYGTPFAVAIIDIDDLAFVNNSYGEASGDAILNHVARVVESAKRSPDVVVRLSDDEIALVLLECDSEGALAFARRLTQYVSDQPAKLRSNGEDLTFTVGVSIGVAPATDRQNSAEELVARARHNLEIEKKEKANLWRGTVHWA